MTDPIQYVPLPPPDGSFEDFFVRLEAALHRALDLPDLDHPEEQAFAA